MSFKKKVSTHVKSYINSERDNILCKPLADDDSHIVDEINKCMTGKLGSMLNLFI